MRHKGLSLFNLVNKALNKLMNKALNNQKVCKKKRKTTKNVGKQEIALLCRNLNHSNWRREMKFYKKKLGFRAGVFCCLLLFFVLTTFLINKNAYSIHAPDSSNKMSVIDTLRLNANRSNKTSYISILGSSVTAGSGASSVKTTWIALLCDYLKDNINGVAYYNHGYGGFSTSDILAKVDEVISERPEPDIVIFETCVINDAGKGIPIRVTISNIDKIVHRLQKGLPNARIIIQSPNPILNTARNALGLTYQDYIEATKAHIASKGWEYVDVHNGFNKQRLQDGLGLRDTLADGYHPNDIGYRYWFNILKDYFITVHSL